MMRLLLITLVLIAGCTLPIGLAEPEGDEIQSTDSCPRYHIEMDDGTRVFFQPIDCEEKPVLIQ